MNFKILMRKMRFRDIKELFWLYILERELRFEYRFFDFSFFVALGFCIRRF